MRCWYIWRCKIVNNLWKFKICHKHFQELVFWFFQEQGNFVLNEKLSFNEQPLFEFSLNQDQGSSVGQARIYNDDPDREGAFLPVFDWSRSGVNFVHERLDNQKLILFKKRLKNFFIVQINSFAILEYYPQLVNPL
jgi:hypothetical protein